MPEIETMFQIVPSVMWPYSTSIKLRWVSMKNLALQIIGPLGGEKSYISVDAVSLHKALHQMAEDRDDARRQPQEIKGGYNPPTGEIRPPENPTPPPPQKED